MVLLFFLVYLYIRFLCSSQFAVFIKFDHFNLSPAANVLENGLGDR